jgi:hypothetical protein
MCCPPARVVGGISKQLTAIRLTPTIALHNNDFPLEKLARGDADG